MMIPTEFLLQMKERGILATLFKYGMVSSKYATILEIRLKVDALMRQGRSRGEAVKDVAKSTGLTIQSIYKYLKH